MNNLPIPTTTKGWKYGAILTFIAFMAYYFLFYPGLERVYYGHYWTAKPYPISNTKLQVDVFTPRYLYSFEEREIKIQVENTDPSITNHSINVVIRACKPQDGEKAECNPPDDYIVLMCQSQSNTTIGCDSGSNAVSFSNIPAYGTLTKNIWISVKPTRIEKGRNNNESGEIDFAYDVRVDNLPFQSLNLSGASIAKVSLGFAFWQSFLGIVLLPPWTNGLILALSLFITRLYEGHL